MDERKQRDLRDVSDRLLDELQGIRDAEEQKRREEISTPGFHRLNDQVAARSRRVFELASEEDVVSERFDEPQHRSVNDVPPTTGSGA